MQPGRDSKIPEKPAMKFEELILDDIVVRFETGGMEYTAESEGGRLLHILKVFNHQPPIVDEENYSNFLWIKAFQGYYIFRQDFLKRAPLPWVIIREIVPEDPGIYFFEQFDDLMPDYLDRLLQSEACATDH